MLQHKWPVKTNLKTLLIYIAIPLLVGGTTTLLTRNSMESFQTLNKPPLAPPDVLFPIVWTVLYVLMGIASYLIASSQKNQKDIQNPLTIYSLQLAINFLWPIFFFRLEWYLFSFFWIFLLWIFIFNTIRFFYPIHKTSAYLLMPYLLWVTFASYLNLFIFILNN